ncbi:hypothetical protein QZH41_007219 [Actinostola sp. cb2023]|nr:hypothetical protein QZH41_007219 [Actinostola sp. cb2023]
MFTTTRLPVGEDDKEYDKVMRTLDHHFSPQSIFDDFKECLEGVGKLKDFKAKLHVDETVKPVAQKQRPVPFGLREKVEMKLDELVNADIIEPVEGPTPWVSPVVVVPKTGGDIRLCVDMRKANEAIIRERHPIPTVDDVLYNINAPKIIESLDKIFCTHGLPVTLRTDNGPQFVSEQFESYLAENGISHKTSTPLLPQANGEVERQNRSILKILKIAHSEKKDMQAELRKFLMAYRTTQHSSTGSTPAKLLFNREMKSKLPQLGDSPSTHMHTEARDKDSETKQKRADYTDAKRGAKENDIAPGDRVLLKQRKEKKLSTTFGDE